MNFFFLKKKLKILNKIIFVSKWVFNKPKKAKILIYDNESVKELNFFLKKKSFEIFHNRYEQINIYVLLYSIFKNGLRNIKKNYKLNYFNFVKPKLVITLIDENPGFFKLKNIYKQAKYVSVQLHFKDNIFYDYINKFNEKNKSYNFRSDYSFVIGENDRLKYRNYINGEIINLGSIKNNNYIIKKKFKRKVDKILFIASIPINRNLNFNNWRGYKIFQLLKKYCREKNIKLYLLSKHRANFEKKYRQVYKDYDWIYLPLENSAKTYQTVNKAEFVVFDNTTLGYEALSKGIKGVCFPRIFPYKNYSRSYDKEGFFWSTKLNKEILDKKINSIIKITNNRWKVQIKKIIKDIMIYNPNNELLIKKLNKIYK